MGKLTIAVLGALMVSVATVTLTVHSAEIEDLDEEQYEQPRSTLTQSIEPKGIPAQRSQTEGWKVPGQVASRRGTTAASKATSTTVSEDVDEERVRATSLAVGGGKDQALRMGVRPMPKKSQRNYPEFASKGDVLVDQDGYCASMCRDDNGDLYAAVLRDDGAHPYRYIRIRKSTDNGASWSTWRTIYSSAVPYNLPSIEISRISPHRIVVVYMYGNEIHAYWRCVDGSSSGFATVDSGNCSHPSICSLPMAPHVWVSYRDNGSNQIKATGSATGDHWDPPEVVDSGADLALKFDGAIAVGGPGLLKPYVAYFGGGQMHVARREPPWQRVLTVNADFRWPDIEADPDPYSFSVLFHAQYHNNSPLTDLAFGFSYDSGDPGTWEVYYWDDPEFNQWWPALDVSLSGGWFHAGYWDEWPDGVLKAAVMRARYDDLLCWEGEICSESAVAPPIQDAGKAAVVGIRHVACVAWEDARSGGDYDTYCNGSYTWPGVEEKGGAVTISSIPSLSQNHPNPFSSATAISYQSPNVGRASLTIYDIAGQVVRTLADEHRAAGHHTVIWDGRDGNGQKVAPGIYLYRLTARHEDGGDAGDFSSTKKMVVLR